MKVRLTLIVLVAFLLPFNLSVAASEIQMPGKKERCPVCGMFVAKYPTWLAQVKTSDGKTYFFDGVKDMLAFYFEPEKYGGNPPVEDIFVTDYYAQKWVDGRKALYVIGSDTTGPMGHEFIPFDSLAAAESFKSDHHGKDILAFDQITLELVNQMRTGMKGMKMKHN